MSPTLTLSRGVQDSLREQEAVLLRCHAEALAELRARAVAAPSPAGSGAAQAALAVHPDTISLFITLCGPIPPLNHAMASLAI